MPNENNVFLVKANGFEFTFQREEIEKSDIIKRSENTYNLVRDNRSVNAHVIEVSADGKRQVIEVEGETYTIEIRDELDQMLDSMGFSKVTGRHIREIKAPMPGLVLQIAVTEGQELQEGDKTLILEAMKMENSIQVPVAARVKKILVKPGQAVEKGQVLIELE